MLGDIKKQYINDITINRSLGSCDVRSHTVSVVTKGDCRSEIFNWLKAQQLFWKALGKRMPIPWSERRRGEEVPINFKER